VVIPTHNHAHYLGEAIASALSQVDVRPEIIVVDDGSTDNPAAVVDAYLACDSCGSRTAAWPRPATPAGNMPQGHSSSFSMRMIACCRTLSAPTCRLSPPAPIAALSMPVTLSSTMGESFCGEHT
jgi:cellulose synthase/poly-beta-1,6-N-acetylglucosamine synthase-like glycosyltransferase